MHVERKGLSDPVGLAWLLTVVSEDSLESSEAGLCFMPEKKDQAHVGAQMTWKTKSNLLTLQRELVVS